MRGITDVTLMQKLGQPSLTIKMDRGKISRFGLNVDDVNKVIPTAISGDPVRYALVARPDDRLEA